jgi:hypothetical protein
LCGQVADLQRQQFACPHAGFGHEPDDDLVAPRSKILALADLNQIAQLRVGQWIDHLLIQLGRRYPQQHIGGRLTFGCQPRRESFQRRPSGPCGGRGAALVQHVGQECLHDGLGQFRWCAGGFAPFQEGSQTLGVVTDGVGALVGGS